MLIIILQLMVVLAILLLMDTPSMSKFVITPIVKNPILEFSVFDLEYTLRILFFIV